MAKAAPSTLHSPIIVLAGDELFLRIQALDELKRTVLGEGDPGMALVRFDGTAAIADILDECRMPSMFAPRKLVVVDPADPLMKASINDTPAREVLERYLEEAGDQADPSAVLVLVCDSWLKTTRLHKALDKRGAVRWCDPIKEYQAVNWAAKRARDAYGKALDPVAAQRLADLIGPDMQRLDNELAKLVLYQPDAATISVQAVEALVGFQHEQPIWDMINALAERNAPVALQKIDELWQLDPKIEYTAIGAVSSWLSQVLKAREMLDRRQPDGAIIRELKLWPEDRARRVLSLARNWGLAGADRWSRELLYVDLANKTSLGEPRRNLEKFVVQLCA